jgi:hypothetical protein
MQAREAEADQVRKQSEQIQWLAKQVCKLENTQNDHVDSHNDLMDRYEEQNDLMILLEREHIRAKQQVREIQNLTQKLALAYKESDAKHTRRVIEFMGLLKKNEGLLEKVVRVTSHELEEKMADDDGEGGEDSSGSGSGGDEDNSSENGKDSSSGSDEEEDEGGDKEENQDEDEEMN